MLFEGLLDTIARLAFSFDVIIMVLNAGPALVRASGRVEVGHHVLALAIVVGLAVAVCFAGCVCGDAVEGPVTFHAVYYLVVGRGFEGLAVGFAEGVERRVVGVVAGVEGGIVGAAVVVGADAGGVEVVDCVRVDVVFTGGVPGFVGEAPFGRYLIERTVRHVAGVSLVQRGTTTASAIW